MSKAVHVYRIEYEKLPNLDYYTAHIGAYSHEEALEQITRRIGSGYRLVASGSVGRLDDLSFEVRDRMLELALGKKKKKSKEEEKISATVGFKDISKRGIKKGTRREGDPTQDSGPESMI